MSLERFRTVVALCACVLQRGGYGVGTLRVVAAVKFEIEARDLANEYCYVYA